MVCANQCRVETKVAYSVCGTNLGLEYFGALALRHLFVCCNHFFFLLESGHITGDHDTIRTSLIFVLAIFEHYIVEGY